MAGEQGFRRLTLVASIGGLCAALTLTAVDVLLVTRYVSAEQRSYSCLRAASGWAPPLDDFVRVRVRWDWSDSRDSAKWTELAESAVTSARLGECLTHDRHLPEHLRRAFATWFDSDLVPVWARTIDVGIRTPVVLVLTWGTLLALISAAIPWPLFYVLRWIVTGFRG
jgi:hypothetical protein